MSKFPYRKHPLLAIVGGLILVTAGTSSSFGASKLREGKPARNISTAPTVQITTQDQWVVKLDRTTQHLNLDANDPEYMTSAEALPGVLA